MAIVIVSRGCYRCGSEVAERAAARLGYACISREVLLEASKIFDIPELRLTRAIEEAPSLLERLGRDRRKYIAFIRTALLREVQKDNVVYHGYAGHFFLRGIPAVLKARVFADLEERIREEMEQSGSTAEKARERVLRDDEERRRWALSLYGMDPADPGLYDVLLHIGTLTVEDAARLLAEAAALPSFRMTPEAKRLLNDRVLEAQVESYLIEEFPRFTVTVERGAARVRLITGFSLHTLLLEKPKLVEKVQALATLAGAESVHQRSLKAAGQVGGEEVVVERGGARVGPGVDAVGEGVVVDGYEQVGSGPGGSNRTEGQRDGGGIGAGLDDLGAVGAQEPHEVAGDGEVGIGLAQTGWTGGAEGRVAGVDGDPEARQGPRGVDARWAAQSKFEGVVRRPGRAPAPKRFGEIDNDIDRWPGADLPAQAGDEGVGGAFVRPVRAGDSVVEAQAHAADVGFDVEGHASLDPNPEDDGLAIGLQPNGADGRGWGGAGQPASDPGGIDPGLESRDEAHAPGTLAAARDDELRACGPQPVVGRGRRRGWRGQGLTVVRAAEDMGPPGGLRRPELKPQRQRHNETIGPAAQHKSGAAQGGTGGNETAVVRQLGQPFGPFRAEALHPRPSGPRLQRQLAAVGQTQHRVGAGARAYAHGQRCPLGQRPIPPRFDGLRPNLQSARRPKDGRPLHAHAALDPLADARAFGLQAPDTVRGQRQEGQESAVGRDRNPDALDPQAGAARAGRAEHKRPRHRRDRRALRRIHDVERQRTVDERDRW